MNYQEKYQKARKEGYSDQEIMEYLGTKDPAFESKMKKAQEAGYSSKEVLNYFNSAPRQKEEGALNPYVTDVLEQGAQGFGVGALGTYGDILDLLGVQDHEMHPGEKAKYGREFDVLEKMKGGERPSASELSELSDEDITPRFSRLSSSQDVEKAGEKLGLVSEPKTAAGRYAKRIGKLGGGGASLGGGGIVAPIAAGTAGQTLEEMGAPPWMQAAAEIIASLKTAPKSNIPITSKSKEVESVIKDLRKVGYSDKDITLAKNALEERNILKKFATLTPKAENAIQEGLKKSETLFKEQIKKGLPGYAEGGLPYLEKQASNVYQSMEELASSVPIKNKEPFRKAIEESIKYMEKSALLPEEKQFIEFLKEGLEKVDASDTADFMTSFYRKLGKSGKWTDPKTKEHLLTTVQKGIKQSFAESGPEAAKFGNYFEKTNEAWKHWIKTRDFMETIEKAFTVDGMNFKKIGNILNDPKNNELAKKVLGPEQLENIKTITKGADAIESLLKQIKPADKTSKAIKALETIRAFATGSWKTLGVLMGLSAAKSLSTKILFDPKSQNIMKKLIIAAKNNAPQQAAILAQELVEEVESSQDNSGNKR
jgi:hypothetical protein